jgi:hypothetical protein
MFTLEILHQLSAMYDQPTLAVIELNDKAFFGQYSAANASKVLFRRIIVPKLQSWATTHPPIAN